MIFVYTAGLFCAIWADMSRFCLFLEALFMRSNYVCALALSTFFFNALLNIGMVGGILKTFKSFFMNAAPIIFQSIIKF